jgi:hypothetical protein
VPVRIERNGTVRRKTGQNIRRGQKLIFHRNSIPWTGDASLGQLDKLIGLHAIGIGTQILSRATKYSVLIDKTTGKIYRESSGQIGLPSQQNGWQAELPDGV